MEQIKMIQLITPNERKVLITITEKIVFVELENHISVVEGTKLLFTVKDTMEEIIHKLRQLNIIIA